MPTVPTELRKYELMLIVSGDMSETDFEKELDEVRKLLQEHTKGISFEDKWGCRDLAYKIKKQARGYYVVFNFTASPQDIFEMRANIKINPRVLRHLITTVPENYEPGRYKEEAPPVKKFYRETKPEKTFVRFPAVEFPVVEKVGVLEVIEEAKKPTVAGKEEEDQLKTVEKKLEKILENPDIDVK